MTKRPTITSVADVPNNAGAINTNLEALRDGFDNTLSLDGSTPNAMGADLDLNSNDVLNGATINAANVVVAGINLTDQVALAKASAAAALVSEGLADADATQTAADRIQVAADLVSTNQDTLDTAADLVLTNQDTIDTAADVLESEDSNLEANDWANRAEDSLTRTFLNGVGTNRAAGNYSTLHYEAKTRADEILTNADAIATAADVILAEASKAAAAISETNAAASYDSFDDRYLGAKATAPTLDNDGAAILTGALYFDTVSDDMQVWDSAAWVAAYVSLSGALLATNNLSDLTNASTARIALDVDQAGTAIAMSIALG